MSQEITAAIVSSLSPDTDSDIPAIPTLPDRESDDILLPKWIYIKDRDGRYLTQRSGPQYATLTFRSGDPDLECAFQATKAGGSWYWLIARGDHPVMRYYEFPGWYSSDAGGPNRHYMPIHASGNKVYFKDRCAKSLFLSNELRASGAPVGHEYINESSLMEIEQASIKNEITDVEYDISGGVVRASEPIVALSTDVRNDSDATVEETLEYSYEKWKVGTWNNTAGIEIGASATFEAGVPFVASAEFEISVSASYSHSWGGEEGEREVIKSATTVVVPPRKKARARIIVRNAQIDVGFSYVQIILWTDGHSEKEKKTGVYSNVDSWHVDVVLDDWETLPSKWFVVPPA